MTRSPSAPAVLLAVAVVLGVGADTLARVAPARLDAALMLTALVIALIALQQAQVVDRLRRADRVFLAPALAIFIPLLLWRDATALYALNLLACLLLIGLAVPFGRLPLLRAGILTFVARPIGAAFGAGVGMLPLALAVPWRVGGVGAWRPVALAGVGVVAVSPVLVLFATLFASADPEFGHLATRLFSLDVARLVETLAPRAAWVWLAGGVLWVLACLDARTRVRLPRGAGVDPIVPSAALGSIAVLFSLFLGLQARWFFGGATIVATTSNLTLAEYARRGFFELVTVATLTLPVLLFATWSARRHQNGERVVGRVSAVVLVLLGALLISALWRMMLYTSEFGLTEQRLYTTAFMGWLGLTLAWFAATVLRARPARFASGSFAFGLGVLFSLNVIDPDALIARVNLARVREGRPLDVAYLDRLGAGADVQLLEHWKNVSREDQCALAQRFVTRWGNAPTSEPWSLQRRELRTEGSERWIRLREEACG